MNIPKGRLGDILYDNTSPKPPEDQTVNDVLKVLKRKRPQFLIRHFYYRRELDRGYIPNDKVRIGGEPYEIGWWKEIIGTSIEKKFLKMKHNNKKGFNNLLKEVDKNIEKFFKKKNIELEDPNTRPFYLNFIHDGVDCFVHRWNLKYKK